MNRKKLAKLFCVLYHCEIETNTVSGKHDEHRGQIHSGYFLIPKTKNDSHMSNISNACVSSLQRLIIWSINQQIEHTYKNEISFTKEYPNKKIY